MRLDGELDRFGSVMRFLGVPFAEAPMGERRFNLPQARLPWAGVFAATHHGATAQTAAPETSLIPEPAIPGDDYLTVDVFAPVRSEAKMPVMVWVHGGGYTAGSPASPWYDGAAFVEQGIVVVNVSYRLGVEGFGWIEGAPANRGLHDVLEALSWTRRNIAAFGGDPGCVTLAGQSAGGGIVLTLMSTPSAGTLFHRAAALSPIVSDPDPARAASWTAAVADHLGVPPTVDGFGSRSRHELARAVDVVIDGGDAIRRVTELVQSGMPVGPVLDGDLVRASAVATPTGSPGDSIPLLIGATEHELDPLVLQLVQAGLVDPATVHASLGLRDTKIDLVTAAHQVTQRIFHDPIDAVVANRAAATAETFLYRFGWPSPVIGAAVHCIDVPFFFGNVGRVDAPLLGSPQPVALGDRVHDAAVHFIHTGRAPWEPSPGRGPAHTFTDEGEPA